MIRTRLTLTFALLVLLASCQGVFTFWAARTAALNAERSVVATGLLNDYLDLGANKQRLKVWYAQFTLTGDAPTSVRDAFLAKMAASLTHLKSLADRDRDLTPRSSSDERPTVASLEANFVALQAAIMASSSSKAELTQADAWRNLISVFDRSEGRDMRTVLDEAIRRQRVASDAAEGALADALRRMRLASSVLAIMAVLLGVTAVVYFVRRLQRPFADLVTATEAIARGDYAYRSDTRRHDEFGRIAERLNAMAAQLAITQQSGESIRLALDEAVAARTVELTRSYEQLTKIDARRRLFFADISHELRTPVTVIRGEAEIALRGPTRDAIEYQDTLRRVISAAAQLGDRVAELLQLARDDAEQFVFKLVPCVLAEIVSSALHKAEAIAAYRSVRVELSANLHAGLKVYADSDRLLQALVIVLDNAVRYSGRSAKVSVTITSANETASVIIEDQGIGIAEDEFEHLFERHYRGARARAMRPDGVGLGLAIARAILSSHHGEIAVVNNQPCGTRVCITLPLALDDNSKDSQ